MSDKTHQSGVAIAGALGPDIRPDAVEKNFGPYASALARGDWAKASELEAHGWSPKHVESSSDHADDFLARFNKPPAPHWLLIHAPDRFLEWFERSKKIMGEDELLALISQKSSDQPMQFFQYSALAWTMKLAAQKEVHHKGAGAIDYARELAISEALMSLGADPSQGDGKERSCFCFMPASLQGAKLFGEAMLARGGNPQAGLERGNSFFEEACESGRSDWVRLALDWGLSLSFGADRPGALYWACATAGALRLDDDAFDRLLKASDPLELDGFGASALHRLAAVYHTDGHGALSESQREVALKRALILLDAGLDAHAKDRHGRTPWSIAVESPDQRLAKMLGSLKTRQALEDATGPATAEPKKRAPGL